MRLCAWLCGVVLAASVPAGAAEGGAATARVVAVDQVGYPRELPKYAFAREPADSFVIIDADAQSVSFRGPMELWKSPDAATARSVYRGEFSAFRLPGRYRAVTSRGDTSSVFSISDTVFAGVYRRALKGFTYQRCGTQLTSAVAGAYQHPACHLLDGVYHSSTDTSGYHATTGGWHDAGDYGKYVVNAGISVGTLLLAYETWPERFARDDVGIAESGNLVPDILDEARYELEWFLRMQHTDGGFWFKVTREQFEGFVMPQNDGGARYIYTLSSAATGDAAACLARAARLFQSYDQAFAEACRQAAVRAWDYLTVHWSIVPPGGFTNPPGTATGEYGDGDDSDERLWAAAELFETTGEEAYHSYVQTSYIFGPLFGGAMWWGDVRPLALLTYLRSKQPAAVSSVKAELASALSAYCDSQVSRRNSSGYHTVLRPGDFNWGSNSGALNAALLLLAGFAGEGDSTYLEVALDQLHYVLGVNGLSRCFLTGTGENPPRQPHHRPSAADGVADPVPGLLAGGPNQYGGDPPLQALIDAGTAPGLCYIDTLPSYASNEIAINWNAPLVALAGFLAFAGEVSDVGSADTVPARFRLEQNYPNPFNGRTVIRFHVADRMRVNLTVYDILGRQVQVLVDEEKDPGIYSIAFDPSAPGGSHQGLASGSYFCQLTARGMVQSKVMVHVR